MARSKKIAASQDGMIGDTRLGRLETGNLPGHLIRRLHQIAVSVFMAETRSTGYQITPVQHAALIAIRQFPGIDQARLADITACDRVTMGGVVNRLEQREYIKRTYVDGDRRSKRLSILPAGQSMLEELEPYIMTTQDIIMQGFTEIERTLFVALLEKALEATNQISRSPMRPLQDHPSIDLEE